MYSSQTPWLTDSQSDEQEPKPGWNPRLPTHSTYAWVLRVNYDKSFWIQETPNSPKVLAKKALSCGLSIKRGDLVCVVSDGHFHYAIAVLHRQPTPEFKLAQVANQPLESFPEAKAANE